MFWSPAENMQKTIFHAYHHATFFILEMFSLEQTVPLTKCVENVSNVHVRAKKVKSLMQ